MKSYIDDLFKYIDTYESNYSQFETEAFLQTYNGIVTVYQTLRGDRNQAVEVDYYFLDKIKLHPLTSSDLRQLAVQTLITRFESEVDTDGRSNQAYSYCRNLRPVKQDVPFFERNLAQLLFTEGSLNNNFRLNAFLLREMAGYINKYGKSVKSDMNPEEFDGLSDSLKMLELQRRRLALGAHLVKDRTTLEFHLQRVATFNRIGAKGRLYDHYLTEWSYLARTSIWARFGEWLRDLGAKFRGAFQSFGYFRLLSTQRKLAYLTYTLLIIIFLGIALGTIQFWKSYEEKKLEEFQNRATELHELSKP
ncbi:MAG: hypothetical protein JSV52_01065 [Candidatus Zixiibacteriota bacterium]|nr:MAG: hypothetical protein JSV52_01065 [candidate division Zixibacteria bacterium]